MIETLLNTRGMNLLECFIEDPQMRHAILTELLAGESKGSEREALLFVASVFGNGVLGRGNPALLGVVSKGEKLPDVSFLQNLRLPGYFFGGVDDELLPTDHELLCALLEARQRGREKHKLPPSPSVTEMVDGLVEKIMRNFGDGSSMIYASNLASKGIARTPLELSAAAHALQRLRKEGKLLMVQDGRPHHPGGPLLGFVRRGWAPRWDRVLSQAKGSAWLDRPPTEEQLLQEVKDFVWTGDLIPQAELHEKLGIDPEIIKKADIEQIKIDDTPCYCATGRGELIRKRVLGQGEEVAEA